MPNWTASQQNAIDAERMNLLVSAGAGSGKTTVLTHRILKRIENGDSITDFLVVTFTKASASDLRKKLYEEITKLSLQNPAEKRYRTQTYLLPSAHISTIHSYCLEIVRANFQTLGISPKVRMADEQETKLIASDVMELVTDEFYESGDEGFALLADTFSGTKDDAPLSETMLDLYGKLRAYAEYFGWLEEKAQDMLSDARQMENGLFSTVIGRKLQEKLVDWFTDIEEAAEALYSFASGAFAVPKPCEIASLWRDAAKHLKNGAKQSYKAFVQAAEEYRSTEFGRISYGKARDADKQHFAGERDRIKKEIERLTERFACGSEEAFAVQFSLTGKVLSAAKTFLLRFEALYAEAKRDAGVMDFSDAEHFLLRLLEKDGEPTPLCLSLRRQIKEIYIDEYQDVSPLQDHLFTLLSSGNNRFMVGDVKQSIYRFRNAYPDIFLSYKDAYADYAKGVQSARIFLRENFRSGENVIAFVNLLFGKVTAGTAYEREYKGEELVFAKQTEAAQLPVTVAVVPYEERSSAAATELEAEYIAEEILRLIETGKKETKNGEEPYRYGDIVLLFRALKGATAPYENALKKRGIPYTVTTPEPFFEQPEILLAVALLQAIDDPTDDISLFSAMRSPVSGFTDDELYTLRIANRNVPFYRSVQTASEGEGALAEKCREFLTFLAECRESAEGKPCHAFLWELYTKSGILPLCSRKEKRGLLMLYEYARNFENTGFKGLSGLIAYLQAAKEKGVELPGFGEGGDSDRVTLTTIHKSKGLEYPAVFLCGTHRQLFSNFKKTYTLLRTDGLFFKLRDYERLTVTDTLPNRYAALQERDVELGEELRKLYVACTRAREKLYITGAVTRKNLESGSFNPRAPKSLLDLVLAAVCGSGDKCFELIEVAEEEVGFHTAAEKEKARLADNTFLTERAVEAVRFVYPNPSDLPAKVSVSELKETASGAEVIYEARRLTRAPAFLREEPPKGGAEAGTANHLFLQFCDFEYAEQNGIPAEIARLREKRMLDEMQIALLDTAGLQTFFASDLYGRMRKAERFWRERRFSVQASASLLGGKAEETVLLQGVVDCFFEEADGRITVVDYKTDRVKDGSELREKHRMQLECYRLAVSAMTGKPVAGTAIWSFCLNREV